MAVDLRVHQKNGGSVFAAERKASPSLSAAVSHRRMRRKKKKVSRVLKFSCSKARFATICCGTVRAEQSEFIESKRVGQSALNWLVGIENRINCPFITMDLVSVLQNAQSPSKNHHLRSMW